jgi:uncharacterized protein
MRVTQVTVPTGQVHCAGDLYLPEGSENGGRSPGVVMGHSVVMVKEALRPHAEYLVRAGFVVLAIDYRTIGASEGEPRGQWFPERQAEDMRAGVSFLAARPEVDPARIGLWGHSTAAGVAIVAGALDRRIACVATQNPSLLDAWAALEKTRGREPMGAMRACSSRTSSAGWRRATAPACRPYQRATPSSPAIWRRRKNCSPRSRTR